MCTSKISWANVASTPAGPYGTLVGESWGYSHGFGVRTKVDSPGRLIMKETLHYTSTGIQFGTPAYTDEYSDEIWDDIDLTHWHNKLKIGESVTMFASHEVRGQNSYVVYTRATTTYNPYD